ncbi:hypothetical protein [Allobaculum sp. JKK-2023]|uniref:hypothetical protein n=1 Tax=Allobaculum sp. JKK-2023 TaxID=3108943 RepID=UPI002B053135|nr:hypothetical protein [Allobaculum sp. JKK-2023]
MLISIFAWETLNQIVPAIATLMTETILETMDLLQYDQLEQAEDLIIHKKKLLILAQSPNFFEAQTVCPQTAGNRSQCYSPSF